MHVATEEDTDLIRGVEVTAANVHETVELDAVLLSEPARPTAARCLFGGSVAPGAIRGRCCTRRVTTCAFGSVPASMSMGGTLGVDDPRPKTEPRLEQASISLAPRDDHRQIQEGLE